MICRRPATPAPPVILDSWYLSVGVSLDPRSKWHPSEMAGREESRGRGRITHSTKFFLSVIEPPGRAEKTQKTGHENKTHFSSRGSGPAEGTVLLSGFLLNLVYFHGGQMHETPKQDRSRLLHATWFLLVLQARWGTLPRAHARHHPGTAVRTELSPHGSPSLQGCPGGVRSLNLGSLNT